MIRFKQWMFAALLAAPLSAQAAAPAAGAEAQRLLKAAQDADCPAFDSDLLFFAPQAKIDAEGARVEKACLARLTAIKAAHDAADATESTRHEALRLYLRTLTDIGTNEIGRMKPATALEFLENGYAAMIEHNEGGKHFHTLIENLPLMFETHRALAMVGRTDDSAAVLANARQVIDGAYQSLGKGMSNAQMIRDALRAGYQLERHLGYFWSSRSADLAAEGKVAEARAARAMAIEAFGQWLRISDSNYNESKGAFEDKRARSVGAQALHGIARVQFAAGDRAAATKSLAAAIDRVCGIADPLADDAELCAKVREHQRIARGELAGDFSPIGFTGAKERMAALRASLEADVEANNRKVREALGGLTSGKQ